MSPNTTAELLEGPASQPPEGVTSSLTNRSDAQSWYYVSVVLCTVIPGVFLLLLLYTRCFIVRRMDITDGAVVTSFDCGAVRDWFRVSIARLPLAGDGKTDSDIHRACIASVINIVYQARSVQPKADDSYNAAFVGFWVLAELSIGVCVNCLLTLPRLVEAKRKNLERVFSYLARPFTSVAPLKKFERLPNIDTLAPSVTATHRGTGHHFQSEADLTGYKLEPYPSPAQHFDGAKMEGSGHYLARMEHLHDADFQQSGHDSGSWRAEETSPKQLFEEQNAIDN
ncbi:hypothetical protein Q9189_004735 [Teloschistes chrysophthalmus]